MQQNKFRYLSLILLLLLSACITEYYVQLKPDDLNRIVIYGLINNQEGYQSIDISLSSPANKPEYIPFPNCKAELHTSKGIKIPLEESESNPGKYGAFISRDNLEKGTSLKLVVETPDGSIIESSEESIPSESGMDSIYCKKVPNPEADSTSNEPFVRFFVDFNSISSEAKYFWWEEHETFEYHANYSIEWIFYQEKYTHVSPPDSSLKFCWRTVIIPDIILFSNENPDKTNFKEFPLHTVDQINKFQYGYSLEVKQHSLCPSAYNFLVQVKSNTTNPGGLYMKQPLEIIGNLKNKTNPDQTVMGNFGVCATSIKRVFVEPFPEFPEYDYACSRYYMADRDFKTQSYNHPLYVMDNGKHTAPTGEVLSNQCVQCTSFGGTTDKPSFWPR